MAGGAASRRSMETPQNINFAGRIRRGWPGAVRLSAFGADFWRLWYVGLALYIARWAETLAIGVFVYERTHSAFLVAMMTMLRLLPMGLLGAFIGAAAERIERRSALLLVLLAMGLVSAALVPLAFSGRIAVWQLGLACFLNGLGWATDNPVRRVAMGEVVGVERIGTAMSLDVASSNASRMLGPVLGGALLAASGIGGVLALEVGLYATALIAALPLRYRNAPATQGGQPVLASIAEGLRFALEDKRLFGTLLVTVIYNVFAWPFTSMVPVIAVAKLHLNARGAGALASMDGVGALCGAIAIALLIRRRHYGAAYIGGALLYMLMLTAFALAPSAVAAGAALLIEGLGAAAFTIMQATLVYLFAPPEMRSRLLGVLSVCIGIGPIGFLHLGLLAEVIGAPWATVATGVEGLVAMALTWRYWAPCARPLGSHPSDPDGRIRV